MTFLLFCLGILIIFGIARYNESNKLFWTLFVAYTSCFAATKVVYDTVAEKEQSETSLNQAYPTQGLPAIQGTFVCIPENIDCVTLSKVTSSLVSQDYTPDCVELCSTLSDVSGVTQGLYLHVLPNPPNGDLTFDTS